MYAGQDIAVDHGLPRLQPPRVEGREIRTQLRALVWILEEVDELKGPGN